MRVEYNIWGMANRIGNVVVLNKNLKKYPWLHDKLLEHESKHNEKSLYNIKHDLKSLKNTKMIEWIAKTKFMLRYPRSLVQLSPIWFYKGRVYFDLSLMLVYSIPTISLMRHLIW